MNYEQKYKEAMSFLKDLRPHMSDYCKEKIDGFFPELRESEDEKIRKKILELVKQSSHILNPMNQKSMIAWLEKQGEQNPSLSEEDEKMCQETIDWFEKKCFPYALEYENPARESIKWLKSLKDRVQPQPKPEWSGEDENMLKSLNKLLNEASCYSCTEGVDKILDWLKSLKPNHWKPSEEQMEALETTIHISNFGLDIDRLRMLESLYNDLKKL